MRGRVDSRWTRLARRSQLAAIAAAALWLAHPAEATFRGAPGKIAFSRDPQGSPGLRHDIWTVSRSGAEERLTRGSGDDTEAEFSPNGGTIVYSRRGSGGRSTIWAMRANGRLKRRVVSGRGDSFSPTFFPSGRSIAYTAFDGHRDFDLYSVRLDDSRRRLLASNAAEAAISPSGRFLAYSSHAEGGGIRIRDLRTRRTRRLTVGSAQSLDFSPSGRRIVFSGQRPCSRKGSRRLLFGLLAVRVDSGRVSRLKFDCRREFISPVHSPNGRRLLFVRKRIAGTAAGLRFSLGVALPGGRTLDGVRWHRRGADESFPAWQGLRR